MVECNRSRNATEHPHLLDLRIQFAHALDPGPIVVRAADGIDSIPNVCTETKSSAPCATADHCGEAVTLRGDLRKVLGELLKVHLLLIAKLQHRAVRVRVLK